MSLLCATHGVCGFGWALAAAATAACAERAALGADVTLFDNGQFITSVGTGPGGSNVSVAESSVITIGFNANATTAQGGPIRLADDFVISGAPGGGVRLSHMHFYGVQSNSTTNDVHFGAFYVTLYDGPPFAGGNVIAGDFTTNRLLSSAWSGTYRLSSGGASSTSRPITLLDVDMSWAPRLTNGTYWMVVSAVGDSSLSTSPNPQAVFVTPHPANANAQQYFGGTWYAIWDLPFTMYAFCPADYNRSHSTSVQDIFDFLNGWLAGSPDADFNGGGLGVDDIFDFLNAWLAGC